MPARSDNVILPTANYLLKALSRPTLDRLSPGLEIVPLTLRQVLQKQGERVRHVYFLVSGFCSIVKVLADGEMVEVATIGREGMLGMPGALSDIRSSSLMMVQGVGAPPVCYRMSTAPFRTEMARHEEFYRLMLNYAEAFVGFIMQSTACNATHSVEQRLARWLLLASDRMESHDFPLTQEFAAMMLGASRPTVTIVAGTLQKAGLITYRRGQVRILNRSGLKRASCRCYATVVTQPGRVAL